MKKNVKFVNFTGDDSDKESVDEQNPEEVHKKQMKDGGFTLVEEGDANMLSKKHKVGDGVNTTMLGITQEEAQRIYRQTLKRGRDVYGDDDESQAEKKQKTANPGLYKHQAKHERKQ